MTRYALLAAPFIALLLAVLTLLPSVALAQSPPETPPSVTLTRADGTVTASWDAVTNATKYHITYSSDGENSWTAASDNHSTNTITFSGDNHKTYVVGARAGNDNGWSGWTNSPAIAPQLPAAPAGVFSMSSDIGF